ncbi:helix-turn-helix domain-containing protein [Paenibacillus lautus]|uniref:XRE family transcriptional regulator n=1 Tax=Paenibacillus lautus TaxID=1401 RepID=A0A385TB98_PAELA|nr:helix-turn-helix transcriptional regulator [Paenibacillus lautus]AYB41810.1 XRE family transcriptional regulator [Paenibacillus lautus]
MAFSRGKCLLKRRLDERHMTQSELSRRTGYSRQIISHYANDRSMMSPEAMKTISYVLRCSMESLYEWVWSDQ